MRRFVERVVQALLTRHSSGTRPEAGEPLNLTLGAMRIMPIFSVLRGVDSTVGFVVSFVLVASRLVVELLVLHVHLLLRAAGFCVSRSSLLRSLLHRASPVSSFGSFSPFYLQCSVAKFASNPAFERDSPRSGRAPQFNVGHHQNRDLASSKIDTAPHRSS